MPVPEKTPGYVMADGDPAETWFEFSAGGKNPWAQEGVFLPAGGRGCPREGCHHCCDPDCLYADFLRKYRAYPMCD